MLSTYQIVLGWISCGLTLAAFLTLAGLAVYNLFIKK